MTLDELKATLDHDAPPEGLTDEVRAMWLSSREGWEAGHVIVQEIESPEAAWVHAHLHRIEGDLSNAAYWYRRAETSISQTTLEEEWEQLASEFLG